MRDARWVICRRDRHVSRKSKDGMIKHKTIDMTVRPDPAGDVAIKA